MWRLIKTNLYRALNVVRNSRVPNVVGNSREGIVDLKEIPLLGHDDVIQVGNQ